MTAYRRGVLPPAALAAAVGAGLLFGGLDNGYGGAAVLLTAVALALWQMALSPLSRRLVRATVPIWALMAMAALWGAYASMMPHGLAPDLVRHELVGLAGSLLLFTLAASIGNRRQTVHQDIDWLIAILAGIMLVGWLLRLADGSLPFWDRALGDRFTATLNNANVAAGVGSTLVLLATARLIGSKRPGHMMWRLQWVAVVGGWSALVATGSRTSIVATVALTALLFAIRADRRRRHRRSGGMIALAATIACLFLLTTPAAVLLNDRFAFLQDGAVGRWETWSHYGEIAMASPIYGYGLGAFPMLAERYPGSVQLARQLWMVNSPHNILLHLILQAGWPYLLCHLCAVAIVIGKIARVVRSHGLKMEWAGLLAAICAMLANALVDILLEVPATTVLFLLMSGLLFGQAVRRT